MSLILGIVWRFNRVWLHLIVLAFSSSLSANSSVQLDYVGSEQCADCHADQVAAWKGSHHEMAMKHANDDSVLANFNNQSITHKGLVNRFFRKGDEFWVELEGHNETLSEYKISYTFGYEPLQQYMVEFEDGHVQLIPYAWDSRPEADGGQRWFNLYPDLTTSDEFYWLNSGQNWNFMCADCHSTNLQKNYQPDTNTYNTTWSEINVGCEACHGPASKHIKQARSSKPIQSAHFGFDRDLSTAVKEWVYQEGHSTLQPKAIVPTDQLQTCAQCHSRRTQLNENADHVKGSFLDKYRLNLVSSELYHHDGQIYDENYVYGSFLQSEMAKKGVTCTNCHDPHSAKLKIPEEAVCSQCHSAAEYTPEKHTFHQAGSEASQCTTCHMPETTYMQVDPRRDHSWHVPRPDLSKHIGTPNVCTSCHEDKTNQWAEAQLTEWFPNSNYQNQQHFSVAFYADSIGHRGASDALAYSAQDSSLANIIRASSLERMSGNQGQNTLVALARAVKHDNDMIRLGSVQGSSGYNFIDRWQILEPLLKDPTLSVRTDTASALVVHWGEMNPLQREQLTPPLKEYIEIQKFNSDRGFGRTNLGNVYRAQNEQALAEKWYLGAIEVEPYYENSYVNLADLYRSQGKDQQALSILRQGIEAQPNSAVIPYSAGLTLLRASDNKGAIRYLKQAAETADDNAHYWYVYGLSLENIDLLEANKSLVYAYKISENPQYLYAGCEVLARNYQAGDVAAAFEQCTKQLKKIAPENVVNQLKAMVEQ